MYTRKTILCLLALFVGVQHLRGQMELPASPRTEEIPKQPLVKEDPLRVLFVKDEDGELVPLVTSFSYKELREFIDKRFLRADQNRPPAFEIRHLLVKGSSQENFALLNVTVTFQVRSQEAENNGNIEDKKEDMEWTRIPLQFTDAALIDEQKFSGEGQWHLLTNEAQGYDLWFRGSSEPCTIEMQFVVPKKTTTDRTQISFQVPKASISELEFSIPHADISANVINAISHSTETAEKRTLVSATGMSNNVTITWQKKTEGDVQATKRIQVQGDVDVTVDRLGLITSDVTLNLKSFNVPIEKFEVQLPENSTIISENQQAFKVRHIESKPEVGNLYEFTLTRPAREPEPVIFRFETSHYGESGIEPINIAAVEVRDTFLQSGRVRLRVRDDLRVETTISNNVVRVTDPSLSEQNDTPPIRAAYAYFGQPCEISIAVKQQQTRVASVPFHILFVNGNQKTIDLETRLSYSNRGASTSNLEVDLKQWKKPEVKSSVYQVSDIVQSESGPASIRFAEPVQGEFDLNLMTQQDLIGQHGKLELDLPTPVADSIGAGLLIVISSDNVSLRFPTMNDFFDEQIPENLVDVLAQFPTQNKQIRCFRFRGAPTPEKLLLAFDVHKPTIDLNMQHEINLSVDLAKIRQKYVFDVRYKKRPQVSLMFPNELHAWLRNPLQRHKIKVTANGELVDSLRSPFFGTGDSSGLMPVAVPLPNAKLGENTIEVEYEWRFQSLKSVTSGLIHLPLTTTLDGRIGSNRVIVDPRPGIRIVEFSDSEDWLLDFESNESFSLNAVSAFSRQSPTQVSLQVTRSGSETETPDESTSSPTLIKRAWLQTCIFGRQQRVRAVFRIKTNKRSIQFRHPSTISPEEMTVILDGQSVNQLSSSLENVVTISNENLQQSDHLLEIWYHGERPRIGEMRFELPEVIEAADVISWVWQLVLPPNEHVLRTSGDLIPSETWSWTGWYWRRRSTHSQKYLEELTGASTLPAPVGANEYLFISFEPEESIVVYAATRRSMVAIGSGAVLLFGLLLIYVRALRRPIVFFSLALVLGTVAFLFPGPAVLLAQASVLGVVLALIGQMIALVLQRLNPTRQTIQVTTHHDSHVIRQPREDEISKAKTATLSVEPIPVVAPDSKV